MNRFAGGGSASPKGGGKTAERPEHRASVIDQRRRQKQASCRTLSFDGDPTLVTLPPTMFKVRDKKEKVTCG